MSRFFVESVKYGYGKGGIACGPVPGEFVLSIEYKKDDEPNKWLTVADTDGMLSYYLDNEDRLERHLHMNDYEEEITDLNNSIIEEFEGIALETDVEDLNNQIRNEKSSAALLLRYVIDLVEASDEERDDLVALATGKYLDEIEIPVYEAGH